MTIVLWLLALFCFFLVLTCTVWLFATPVEETTIVTDPSTGQVVQSSSETDLTPMILPAIFLAGSVACLVATLVALVKSRKKSVGAG
jgi:hypothetical protein